MIDVHCHLEQKDYEKDLDEVIKRAKENGLIAIITSCAHPKDFERTMEIVERYKNYVFASVGIHPEYIKELKENEIDNFLDLIKENKDKIVSIGEIGLDYYWIKEKEWQEKQKELFRKMINFAKEIKKPITVHIRNACEDCLKILEEENAKKVHLHMFMCHKFVDKVKENGWYVSINPVILRNKNHKKIAKKMPLERIMLETDAPWNSPKRILEGIYERNEPIAVKVVAEKIAEIKKISFEEVERQTDLNAIEFFKLPISKL
ncbi:MAG: hydrolase TatD [Candidatus Aenigmarchaeota archaeon ex4484_224]|nr:MAG: hydrolase TatD [Candidatus Aenigmarchaeota archaeon ex4484_224]